MAEPSKDTISPAMTPLPIIHLNALPGTGKLTIARHLIKLLLENDKNYTANLVHNHLLIDPAGAILPRTSADYNSLRRAIRSAIFNTLAESRDTFNTIYVFTDFQSDDELGSSVMAEYEAMVTKRGSTFIPVILHCSLEENLQRLVGKERVQHGKLVDTAILSKMVEGEKHVFQFPANAYDQLLLDVTTISAEDAAQLIYKHLLKVMSSSSSI